MQIVSGTGTQSYQRLVKTIQELSLARDLNTVMALVRDVARELTGADGCTFILRRDEMCYYVEENAIAPLWKGALFPMESCISGWAMLHKQSVIIEDIYKDVRIPHELYKPTFVKSLAMVPIRTVDPIGAIGNYWAKNHLPTAEEMDLLQSLADITAVSIENIRMNTELEQRVAVRTKELEEVNRELELFSYSVSHDLRAPLRGINGFSTILLEEHGNNLTEEGKRITGKIITNAKKMTNLINDLTDLFKTGKQELVKSLISLSRLVNEVCAELKEEEKNQKIVFNILELPDAMGDKVLLKQLLCNLIGNAIKYSSKKPESIIEIGHQIKDGKTIYYIKDNGAGFDMNYYKNLFLIFQRLHTQREFEGTGIGLAIVQKVISRHGGKVWAESVLSEGATFYFTLE